LSHADFDFVVGCISRIEELKGQRLGTSSMTEGTAIYTREMLARHGLAYPGDYEFSVVGVPTSAGHHWFGLPPRSGLLLTWSGVRGGISVALALSMPPGAERNLILMLTYTVVVFSILVQGLTVARLARVLGLGVEGSSEARH
jgi:hypothetical protein